ncbi:hypothetical protein SAMN04488131_11530 [Flavobacterium xueshanense]|uniref:Uncharacterized protein n=1 Tax=Flavobacterium xueshanense TaxID=935223 RepID=A0A1I2HPM7_9FLAO|nr:hypothetical protein SAMN04488131_11530 [Flavobacterium xueshanense]
MCQLLFFENYYRGHYFKQKTTTFRVAVLTAYVYNYVFEN